MNSCSGLGEYLTKPTKNTQHVWYAQSPTPHSFWNHVNSCYFVRLLLIESRNNIAVTIFLFLQDIAAWELENLSHCRVVVGLGESAYFIIWLGFHFREEMQLPCSMSQQVLPGIWNVCLRKKEFYLMVELNETRSNWLNCALRGDEAVYSVSTGQQ